MAAAPRLRYTHAEYLTLERGSAVKHEYASRLILAMAGGSPEHGARAARIIAALSAGLAGKRRQVFNSDVRVRIAAANMTVYPDVSVVCGQLETDHTLEVDTIFRNPLGEPA